MSKYYAVAKGVKTGIFRDWSECSKNVTGFSGAIYKSFKSKEDAEKFLKSNDCEISDGVKRDEVKEVEKVKETEQIKEPENRKRKIEKVDDKEEVDSKKQKTHINIYTDGGCSNNGKSGASAGIGVYFEGHEYDEISERLYGKQTNNRAELTAIKRALEVVNEGDNIIIHTDSEYSMKGITGINKINLNGDLFSEIKILIKNRKGETIFKKVKGHTGVEDGNFHADRLATKAIHKYLQTINYTFDDYYKQK